MQPIHKDAPRILVMVPGGVNYFYDAIGKRFADAFRNIGCLVDVRTLGEYQTFEYDFVLYVNPYEIGVMYVAGYSESHEGVRVAAQANPDLSRALQQIRVVQRNTRHSGALSLDCVHTEWFARNHRLCQAAGIETLYDLGFHSQAHALSGNIGVGYQFLFNALTQRERQQVLRIQHNEQERPIPWAFIGHFNLRRLEFAHTLVKRLGSEGVFYLPELEPFSADGPHFNATQLWQLLKKTRYYVWISHHDYFYIESERFRDALMAGCVPIKVRHQAMLDVSDVPFNYLILSASDFDDHLQTVDYYKLRQRFIKDYLAKPSLEIVIAQEMLLLQPNLSFEAKHLTT
jgi:hypothetical protein